MCKAIELVGLAELDPPYGLTWLRDFFDQAADDFFDADAVGFGSVVDQNAVPHDRVSDGFDIVDRDVRTTVEDGSGFGAEDQILAGSQTGAPVDPIVNERRRLRFARSRRCRQSNGVAGDVFCPDRRRGEDIARYDLHNDRHKHKTDCENGSPAHHEMQAVTRADDEMAQLQTPISKGGGPQETARPID